MAALTQLTALSASYIGLPTKASPAGIMGRADNHGILGLLSCLTGAAPRLLSALSILSFLGG